MLTASCSDWRSGRVPFYFCSQFYSEEGNWDLVGNNTPIFFIRDPILFPSFIHTQKRNPATHLKDADMFWDFISLRPETTHQVGRHQQFYQFSLVYLVASMNCSQSYLGSPGFLFFSTIYLFNGYMWSFNVVPLIILMMTSFLNKPTLCTKVFCTRHLFHEWQRNENN